MLNPVIILALDSVQEVSRESAFVTSRAVRMEVSRERPVEFLKGLLILANELIGFFKKPCTEQVEDQRPAGDIRDKIKVLDRPFGNVFVAREFDVDIAAEFMEDGGDATDFGGLGIFGYSAFDGFEESAGLSIILCNGVWMDATYCFSKNFLAPFCTPLRILVASALSLDLFKI